MARHQGCAPRVRCLGHVLTRVRAGKKDRYRLDSVWLLLQHKDLEYAAYMKIATEQKIPPVRRSHSLRPLLMAVMV